MIEIIKPGIQLTIQDFGRNGYRHLGVSQSGSLDRYSQIIANRLVNNPDDTAVLELSYGLAQLKFHCDRQIAITGAHLNARHNDQPIYPGWNYLIKSGDTVSFATAKTGLTVYIAIQGGLECPIIMGSAATDLAASFGGFSGRALNSGDKLALKPLINAKPYRQIGALCTAPRNHIRLHPSIHHELLGNEVLTQFISGHYTISEHSNRMGARLHSANSALVHDVSIASLAVAAGCIQLPPNGEPIVLLNDCQTTGGYPLLGCVIAADLHHFAQLKPRDTVTFSYVSEQHAELALNERQSYIQRLGIALSHHNKK